MPKIRRFICNDYQQVIWDGTTISLHDAQWINSWGILFEAFKQEIPEAIIHWVVRNRVLHAHPYNGPVVYYVDIDGLSDWTILPEELARPILDFHTVYTIQNA